MSLISYRNLTVSFGGPLLLDNVGVTIERKERICLLGRNGEGKINTASHPCRADQTGWRSS